MHAPIHLMRWLYILLAVYNFEKFLDCLVTTLTHHRDRSVRQPAGGRYVEIYFSHEFGNYILED